MKTALATVLIIAFSFTAFAGCIEHRTASENTQPELNILHPSNRDVVVGKIDINGVAFDADGNNQIRYIEIKIQNQTTWTKAEGKTEWNYSLNTQAYQDGIVQIQVRAWDGTHYSQIHKRDIIVSNPKETQYGTHRWAIFVAAANFPEDQMQKLGNGGLRLAENMSTFFIEEFNYDTSNIYLLFDDGWIRDEGGFGKPVQPLAQIPHQYNINYGAATKENVINTIDTVITEANKYDDSEVFLWIFNHGHGNFNQKLTGGKILEPSAIYLWDGYLIDEELGQILSPLQSTETCVILDACYIGGFADKTIYNLPTIHSLRSGVPQQGRVVMSSTSKFRTGIAYIEYGPLFSLLWFDGLRSGEADGFRPGFLNRGTMPRVMVKDDKVTVEEAFYYARYLLRNVDEINQFNTMQPQINDQFPQAGYFQSRDGLILGD